MKKIKNIIQLSLLIIAALIGNGCTKNFADKNTNPKLITEELITPELVLTGVEVSAGSGLGFANADNYCGMNNREDNAPFEDYFDDAAWNATYTAITNNLAAIIRKTADDPELVNKKAIARVLKAWIFAQCTDIYGDIPYSESNKAPDDAVTHPKYDLQKDIYTDLLKELKEAATELDPAKASYGSADLLYQGDVTKWKKFANSLRLRLALRVRYADAELAKSNITDLAEPDLITSPSDQALFFTSNDVPAHWNPDYITLVSYGTGPESKSNFIGKSVLDILSNGDAHTPLDPRIKIVADTAYAAWPSTLSPPIPYFGYRGRPLIGSVPVQEKYPYGYESVSRRSDFWSVPVIEQPILRASEVYFALAEAALYNLITGDANAYYKKGIEASIAEYQLFYDRTKGQLDKVEAIIRPDWTSGDISQYVAFKQMTDPEISNFLASSTTTLTGSDEQQLEQIINQKIVALFPSGLEGWSEWRRTGYPRVLVASDETSALHGVSYRRGHYPSGENLVNTEKIKEAKDRMGGKDEVLNHVWWDANPDAPHQHSGAVESQPDPWQ
ncbi:MAG: SusD/RagB family nutrient-binding outer membrane lipoprotein [Flavitalea sp.]